MRRQFEFGLLTIAAAGLFMLGLAQLISTIAWVTAAHAATSPPRAIVNLPAPVPVGGEKGAYAQLALRPLILPSWSARTGCPVSVSTPLFVIGDGYTSSESGLGPGPVYLHPLAGGGLLLRVDGSYAGTLMVRGRDLQSGRAVLLARPDELVRGGLQSVTQTGDPAGTVLTPQGSVPGYAQLRIGVSTSYPTASAARLPLWHSYMTGTGPRGGCYGLQLDGQAFSEIVVYD